MIERRPRVLVIDDEATIREVTRRMLEDSGYEAAEAPDARTALALTVSSHFDAVVTDVRMPGLSGLDLLAELKRTNPNAVVVVMTGYADMDIVLTALRAGADDFVVKPVDLRALSAVVQRAIDRRDLRADLAALRRQADLKDRFVTFVSHKLNTPLTSILLFLDALAGEESPERRLALLRDSLPDALAAAGRLESLIAGLLRFAEATSGVTGGEPSPRRALPLEPLLVELVGEARSAAGARGIVVTLVPSSPAGIAVFASREALWRALHELLDNAVKFNRDGGQVRVEAARAAGGEWVEIRVIDTGPGIPEADLPKVLEPFQQVDPAFTGQVPGFGLGLPLARRLVEGEGGRLVIASSPDGTVATVTLPAA